MDQLKCVNNIKNIKNRLNCLNNISKKCVVISNCLKIGKKTMID